VLLVSFSRKNLVVNMAPKDAEQKAGKSKKAEKKPVKAKAEKRPIKEGGKQKKKKAKSIESYKIYIYRVLKQVSP
jgi:histone H2B